MKVKRLCLNKTVILPLLMTLTVALAGFVNPFNTYAEQSVDAALKRSLVTFGVARGLNAVISIAQGTEVNVTPAGMGVTLAPGEVLDPVNDLVERFSGFMLISSVALGIQKTLLAISNWVPYSIGLAVIGGLLTLCGMLSMFPRLPWLKAIWKIFVVLVAIRFFIPCAVIGSEWLYAGFLQNEHEVAEQGIDHASNRVKLINQAREQNTGQATDASTWDHIKHWAAGAKQKAAAVVDIQHYSAALKATAHDVIQLIVVFCLCTFLFPVGIVFFLWRLTRWALAR